MASMNGLSSVNLGGQDSPNADKANKINNITETGTESAQDATNARHLDIFFHTVILRSAPRMRKYREAIFRNDGQVVKGKVVADCGTGTGLLAMWCALAGAKKVYAIEPNDNIILASKNIEANGLGDVISVIKASAQEAELPEKVDVIISEVVAGLLLHDGVLPHLLDFRDRWLKEDGVMLPETATVSLAPISDPRFWGTGEMFYQTFDDRYGINMETMLPYYRKTMASRTFMKGLLAEDVKATPAVITTWDFRLRSSKMADRYSGEFQFTVSHQTTLHGFAVWFAIGFPGGVSVGCGPFEEMTSWRTAFLYLEEPIDAQKGDKLTGVVRVNTNVDHPPYVDTNLAFSVNGGPTRVQDWTLGTDVGQVAQLPSYDWL